MRVILGIMLGLGIGALLVTERGRQWLLSLIGAKREEDYAAAEPWTPAPPRPSSIPPAPEVVEKQAASNEASSGESRAAAPISEKTDVAKLKPADSPTPQAAHGADTGVAPSLKKRAPSKRKQHDNGSAERSGGTDSARTRPAVQKEH